MGRLKDNKATQRGPAQPSLPKIEYQTRYRTYGSLPERMATTSPGELGSTRTILKKGDLCVYEYEEKRMMQWQEHVGRGGQEWSISSAYLALLCILFVVMRFMVGSVLVLVLVLEPCPEKGLGYSGLG
ncbi:hypothetical protein VTL71DRAFT_9215 [Oculimacula yallundae]|uniref:Uncharacterized protein n=1 Tax=Oculimacula yallundae TaxID=86028 RepID=A0ABR4BU46_9HELO